MYTKSLIQQQLDLIKSDIENVIKKYLDTNIVMLSLFDYEESNVLYKYNVKYINNNVERTTYEK